MEHVLTIPKDSREAFRLSTQKVGVKKTSEVLNCTVSHVYKMGASKKTNGQTREDPFSQAFNLGRTWAKEKLFTMIYSAVDPIVRLMPGATIAFQNRIPDKEHFTGEVVDFSLASAGLQETCRRFIEGEATETQMMFEETELHNAAGQLVEKAKEERLKRNSN